MRLNTAETRSTPGRAPTGGLCIVAAYALVAYCMVDMFGLLGFAVHLALTAALGVLVVRTAMRGPG